MLIVVSFYLWRLSLMFSKADKVKDATLYISLADSVIDLKLTVGDKVWRKESYFLCGSDEDFLEYPFACQFIKSKKQELLTATSHFKIGKYFFKIPKTSWACTDGLFNFKGRASIFIYNLYSQTPTCTFTGKWCQCMCPESAF